jgi:uncharacterized membrane protein YagU involved in acid resistance
MAEISLDRRFAAHKAAVWEHGLVGGLFAGVVMALALMIIFALTGAGFVRPLELFGSVWYGAMTTGATVAAIGLASHLVLSVVFGLLYSFLITFVRIEPLLTGLVYGIVVWLLVYFAAGAFAGYFTDGMALWSLVVVAALFGLSLGGFEDWADRRWTKGMKVR